MTNRIIGLMGLPLGHGLPPVGGLDSRLLRRWADAVSRLGGRAVVFTAGGVLTRRGRVRGWAWLPMERRWQPGIYPLPQVVYERILSRRAEAAADPVVAYLRRRGCRVFNGGYLDKAAIYQLLQADPQMAGVLPETADGRWERLGDFLSRHQSVYLKPRRSCEGQGMLRINRAGGGLWRLHYRRHGANRTFTGSPAAVTARARRLMGQRGFVLQQGIDLLQHQNRPCDFRVMVQRDGQGGWRLTTVGAKMAGDGSITTHVRTGGRALAAPLVLRQFGEEEAAVGDRLTQTSLAVAAYVASRLPGDWGDLGLDLAVDQTGRVWVLEVNSKCGTRVFAAAPGLDLWLERLAAYSLYLARRPGGIAANG